MKTYVTRNQFDHLYSWLNEAGSGDPTGQLNFLDIYPSVDPNEMDGDRIGQEDIHGMLTESSVLPLSRVLRRLLAEPQFGLDTLNTLMTRLDRIRENAADGEVDDVAYLYEISVYLAERLAGIRPGLSDGQKLVEAIESDRQTQGVD